MNSLLRSAALVALTWANVANAQVVTPNNKTMPTAQYMTRPQGYAPVLHVTLRNEPSSGYIFLAPYRAAGAGPYIYDKYGNLVWDGFGVTGAANAHNFHVCQYSGEPHLCLFSGNQQSGYAVGNGLIIDKDYQIVTSVQTGGNARPADQHEFILTPAGKSALLTSYLTIPYDLSGPPYNINAQQGWLSEGVFQEVNIETGDVVFEWFSANHVDVSDSMIAPHSTDVSGDGLTPHTAFDYFHINSLEKSNHTGNYLVSARHTSTLYYINSTDRNIIWRMSCFRPSDFKCNGFNYSFQHDARLLSENTTTTVVSIFDNASNGYNHSDTQSSGKVIKIDHTSGQATLLARFNAPVSGGVITDSQGDSQHLANGNVFTGWGSIAAVSEHAPDHKGSYVPVLYATFTSVDPVTSMSYRAFSFDWESTPALSKPAVYSYARNASSLTTIYVSWNGATTVSTWNFYGFAAVGAAAVKIGSTRKNGFETVYQAPEFHDWVMVEAVDKDGKSLRNSSFQATFVPGSALVSACDLSGCLVSEKAYSS